MLRVCKRCGDDVVYYDVSAGYSCACLECDEDLYLFETMLVEVA